MRAVAWLLLVCGPGWLACSSLPLGDQGNGGGQGGQAGEAGEASAPGPAGEGGARPSEGGQPTDGGAAGPEGEAEGGDAAEGGADAGEGAGGAPSVCDPNPAPVGTLESDALSEVSGIVASARNPGVYYVHNDSGDSARFFAIDRQGRTLAEVVLSGATAVDWEDIALGPGPGGESYVYLGDVGDNNARVGGTPRASIEVHRIREPLILSDEEPQYLELTGWERLPLVYPGAAHDCETLLLDPVTSELLLVTKENDGKSSVFRASALAVAESQQTLELVAQLAFGTTEAPGSSLVTGGDLSPMGDGILLRTYTSIFYWSRAQGSSVAEAFSAAPQQLPSPEEEQGEGITFSADGLSYLTVSESEHAEVFEAQLCDL
jgi:hypothetical protein